MYCKNCGQDIGQGNLFCGNCGMKIDAAVGKDNKTLVMKKAIITGILLLGIIIAFMWHGNSNSFELKTNRVITDFGEKSAYAVGKIEKGTISKGDTITIKRDGKKVKTAKVGEVVNLDDNGEKAVKSISKGETVNDIMVGLVDMKEDELLENDMIVK